MPFKFNAITGKLDYFEAGSASTFISLTDTPSSYSGQSGKFVKVNTGETGLEFGTGGGSLWTDGGTYYIPNNNGAFKINDAGIYPTAIIWHDVTNPATAVSAGLFYTRRRSGANYMNVFQTIYVIDASSVSSGYDVSHSNMIKIDDMTSSVAGVFAGWDFAVGPTVSGSYRGIVGREINVQEREGDQGLKTTPTGKYTAAIQIVPESQLNGIMDGSPPTDGYNNSFGLAFIQCSHTPYPQIHIPLFWGSKSIATNGYGFYMTGGTTSSNDPSYAGRFAGHFDKGLDFSGATINSTNKEALVLADLQTVVFGTARVRGNGNDLEYYDVTSGVYQKLSSMGGFGIDGGAYSDTYISTANVDAGAY